MIKEGRRSKIRRGFTLIELLIVVAIIAILAAIAVPNFLEAQMRAKISRASADMRSIRTAVESYRVDYNAYFETDIGEEDVRLLGVGMIRLTTPISYMSSIPISPFDEFNMGAPVGSPKNANKERIYLWVSAYLPDAADAITMGIQDNSPQDGIDDNYNTDRAAYLGYGVPALNIAERSKGYWMLKSVGPDGEDDRSTLVANARVYDPTNGTVSLGDLVVFSDISGLVGQR